MDEPWPIRKMIKFYLLFAVSEGADQLIMVCVESCDSYRLWDAWHLIQGKRESIVPPPDYVVESVATDLAHLELELAPWPKCMGRASTHPKCGEFDFGIGSGAAHVSYEVTWDGDRTTEIDIRITNAEDVRQAARCELDEMLYDPMEGIID